MIGVLNVNALTSEEISQIYSESKIGIPSFITKDGAKISVYNINDYKISYQWKEITLDLYNEIDEKKEEHSELVKEANDYSSNNRPDSTDSEAVEEFNSRIREYQQEIENSYKEYYGLFPSFPDTWLDVDSENKIYHPTNEFSGKKPYVPYVKVTDNSSNKDIYAIAILQIDGDKNTATNETIEEVSKEDIKTNISNPKTIDKNPNFILVALILLVAVIAVGLKKIKRIK